MVNHPKPNKITIVIITLKLMVKCLTQNHEGPMGDIDQPDWILRVSTVPIAVDSRLPTT